jgi:hypothetical protein
MATTKATPLICLVDLHRPPLVQRLMLFHCSGTGMRQRVARQVASMHSRDETVCSFRELPIGDPPGTLSSEEAPPRLSWACRVVVLGEFLEDAIGFTPMTSSRNSATEEFPALFSSHGGGTTRLLDLPGV